MIKAVIIDDESRARNLLKDLIKQSLKGQVEIVGEGDDVASGVDVIKKKKPDLVFLDIQMHEGTGFDLLQQLEHVDFEVVFVTAYDQYAVDAFKFSAFGYLLKPIKTRELKETVSKLKHRIHSLKQATEKRIKVLVENYDNDQKIKKLVINNNNGFKVSQLEDIIRLEGDGNYTHFIVEGGKKITTSKSLGEYEGLLNDHGFFRIHQSTIVNLGHVKGYMKGAGGEVELSDGMVCKVSRHRKAKFLERFN